MTGLNKDERDRLNKRVYELRTKHKMKFKDIAARLDLTLSDTYRRYALLAYEDKYGVDPTGLRMRCSTPECSGKSYMWISRINMRKPRVLMKCPLCDSTIFIRITGDIQLCE